MREKIPRKSREEHSRCFPMQCDYVLPVLDISPMTVALAWDEKQNTHINVSCSQIDLLILKIQVYTSHMYTLRGLNEFIGNVLSLNHPQNSVKLKKTLICVSWRTPKLMPGECFNDCLLFGCHSI